MHFLLWAGNLDVKQKIMCYSIYDIMLLFKTYWQILNILDYYFSINLSSINLYIRTVKLNHQMCYHLFKLYITVITNILLQLIVGINRGIVRIIITVKIISSFIWHTSNTFVKSLSTSLSSL